MSQRLSAFVWLALCWPLALAPSAVTAQDTDPRDLAIVTTSLKREIEKILSETGIPSISIALIRDGQVVWASAHGYANVGARVPATADTYYSTGSTFKFVTATAVMQLVEKGELTLDTPLNEIVGPDLAVEGADDVTVRHLLCHHSGLDAFVFARRINREGPVSTVPLWSRQPNITPKEILANTRRIGPPGSEFKYSNDGYAILGYIVEIVSGQPFDEYIAKNLLMWGDDVQPLPRFAKKTEVAISPDIFDEYVGAYALTPGLRITVSRVGNRFFIRPDGQTRKEVFASSETDFFLRRGNATFTFGRDEKGGPVTHLILHQNGDRRANRVSVAGQN